MFNNIHFAALHVFDVHNVFFSFLFFSFPVKVV